MTFDEQYELKKANEENKKLKESLFIVQNGAILLVEKLKLAIEQRNAIYNAIPKDERKLFFADKICEALDKEIDSL